MLTAEEVLQSLVGLPLSIVRSAAGMRVFHFGEVRPHHRERGTVGEYALHVQCPWRLVASGAVVTGSSDFRSPPGDGVEADLNDPRAGSLQNVRLATWLGGYDDATKSHLSASGRLVVVSASADQYGGADIVFSDGVRLQLFPDGSVDEDWRFFRTNDDGAHFVIEGGRVCE
jgi:hypothetical protein